MVASRQVAEYMVQRLEKEKELYQADVVWQIKEKFGDDFVYTNQNGNLAIDKNVLREFRSLSEHNVVWERHARMWRNRQKYDPKGKRSTE